MAEVTIELRKILEMENFNLFDFEYPMDDVNYKDYLENLIIDRFYFDEIGLETVDRWKHEFRTKMQTIMPYYNKLYNTTLFDGDPLTTQKLRETVEEHNTGNQTVEVEETSDLRASDYPQTANPAQDILSGQQVGGRENTQRRDDNLMRDQQRIIEGYAGIAYPDLIKKHRDSLLRISSMILAELKDLFILVY